MTKPLFTGVAVALVTLFDDDGRLDAPATAELAGQLIDAGMQAIIAAGSTGEAASLDATERVALFQALRPVTEGRVPLIAGVGAPSTAQALAYLGAACDAGADGLLALSLPGNADQHHYYGALAKASGDVPLLAYHYPGVSAPGIPVAVLRDLPVVGAKDSSGEAERLLEEATTWDQPLYTGSSALLTYANSIGCAGAILALANAEPEACVAAFAGEGQAQRDLAPSHLETRRSFPGAIKALTAKRFGTSTAARMG